jgi:hypothetical protein
MKTAKQLELALAFIIERKDWGGLRSHAADLLEYMVRVREEMAMYAEVLDWYGSDEIYEGDENAFILVDRGQVARKVRYGR